MVFVKILLRLQPLIILGLFAVFLQTFGWPAYKTFLKKEVFIKESHLSPSKLPAPGLTICVSPVRITFVLKLVKPLTKPFRELL